MFLTSIWVGNNHVLSKRPLSSRVKLNMVGSYTTYYMLVYITASMMDMIWIMKEETKTFKIIG